MIDEQIMAAQKDALLKRINGHKLWARVSHKTDEYSIIVEIKLNDTDKLDVDAIKDVISSCLDKESDAVKLSTLIYMTLFLNGYSNNQVKIHILDEAECGMTFDYQ
jgi:hypothetical protein